jgi:hypothetical protein
MAEGQIEEAMRKRKRQRSSPLEIKKRTQHEV